MFERVKIMDTHEKDFSKFMTKYRKDGFQHEYYPEVTEAIKNGDGDAIAGMDWETYSRVGIGKMSNDPVMQSRYLVVVSCTMACMIAVNEGVEWELAASLPDYYIQLAERINNVQELTTLTKNLLIHFCSLIKKQKNIPYSRSIKRVVEYIYNNIYSTIYINDIASALNMSPSYLSKIFKNETGIYLKDYIHMEKMKEAKNLMKYTSMSYTEIASQLGYSDLSHFTKACRTYEGCTPKQLKLRMD